MLPARQNAMGAAASHPYIHLFRLLPCREAGELASVAASLGMGAEAIEAQLVAMGGNWESAREALQGGKRCAPGCGGCVAQRRAAEMGLRRLVVLAASCLLLAYKTCSLPETCNPTPAACLQGCAGPSL